MLKLSCREVFHALHDFVSSSGPDVLLDQVSLLLSRGMDVVLYTSRGVPLQGDGAGGLVFGERVGAALVACVAGLTGRPRFLISKGGITSSDVATQGLGMQRAQVSNGEGAHGFRESVDVNRLFCHRR